MCIGSNKGPAPTPSAPPPITQQDVAATQAGDDERKRRASAQGYQSTILSSPLGAATNTGRQQVKTELGG
ncbi:hypothetical protein [Photobacterium profundum]|uniref:hypothetical protein n=1 Tax=Photobacterium TaxID=657 RepID=UPI000057B737|nr:hypothetical protein [Photobacterium profundum]